MTIVSLPIKRPAIRPERHETTARGRHATGSYGLTIRALNRKLLNRRYASEGLGGRGRELGQAFQRKIKERVLPSRLPSQVTGRCAGPRFQFGPTKWLTRGRPPRGHRRDLTNGSDLYLSARAGQQARRTQRLEMRPSLGLPLFRRLRLGITTRQPNR